MGGNVKGRKVGGNVKGRKVGGNVEGRKVGGNMEGWIEMGREDRRKHGGKDIGRERELTQRKDRG